MKDFYSITPLAYFNASDEEIHLDFCSFVKFTEEQLQARFGDISRNTFSTGNLDPTRSEMEEMTNSYFLCFRTREYHEDHFDYTACALRLLYKFPAKTTKTFREDGADGSFIYMGVPRRPWEKLPDPQDIPEEDVPSHLRKDYRTVKQGQASSGDLIIHKSGFTELREWWLNQYGRFYWQEDTKDKFIKLGNQLRKLIVNEEDNSDLRYLRFAIKWYLTAQDQDYFDARIVFSCLILELLCLRDEGSSLGIGVVDWLAQFMPYSRDQNRKNEQPRN